MILLDRLRKNTVIKKHNKKQLHTLEDVCKILLIKSCHFANLKVDYEKLLCSLYVFSQNCEGLLYKLINAKTQDKKYMMN